MKYFRKRKPLITPDLSILRWGVGTQTESTLSLWTSLLLRWRLGECRLPRGIGFLSKGPKGEGGGGRKSQGTPWIANLLQFVIAVLWVADPKKSPRRSKSPISTEPYEPEARTCRAGEQPVA